MKGWIQWVGGSILFAFIVIQYSTCNKYKEESHDRLALINSIQDTVKYYKDKNGEQVSQISLLSGSKSELLAAIGRADTRLSKIIKSNARSGTSLSQSVKFDTVMTFKADTADGLLFYENHIHDRWVDLHVNLRNDSLRTTFEARDSMTVSFKNIRQGFLKPRKSVVEVTNSSPYVKIGTLNSFEVPKRKSNLKFFTGLGLGVGAGYLLFR